MPVLSPLLPPKGTSGKTAQTAQMATFCVGLDLLAPGTPLVTSLPSQKKGPPTESEATEYGDEFEDDQEPTNGLDGLLDIFEELEIGVTPFIPRQSRGMQRGGRRRKPDQRPDGLLPDYLQVRADNLRVTPLTQAQEDARNEYIVALNDYDEWKFALPVESSFVLLCRFYQVDIMQEREAKANDELDRKLGTVNWPGYFAQFPNYLNNPPAGKTKKDLEKALIKNHPAIRPILAYRNQFGPPELTQQELDAIPRHWESMADWSYHAKRIRAAKEKMVRENLRDEPTLEERKIVAEIDRVVDRLQPREGRRDLNDDERELARQYIFDRQRMLKETRDRIRLELVQGKRLVADLARNTEALKEHAERDREKLAEKRSQYISAQNASGIGEQKAAYGLLMDFYRDDLAEWNKQMEKWAASRFFTPFHPAFDLATKEINFDVRPKPTPPKLTDYALLHSPWQSETYRRAVAEWEQIKSIGYPALYREWKHRYLEEGKRLYFQERFAEELSSVMKTRNLFDREGLEVPGDDRLLDVEQRARQEAVKASNYAKKNLKMMLLLRGWQCQKDRGEFIAPLHYPTVPGTDLLSTEEDFAKPRILSAMEPAVLRSPWSVLPESAKPPTPNIYAPPRPVVGVFNPALYSEALANNIPLGRNTPEAWEAVVASSAVANDNLTDDLIKYLPPEMRVAYNDWKARRDIAPKGEFFEPNPILGNRNTLYPAEQNAKKFIMPWQQIVPEALEVLKRYIVPNKYVDPTSDEHTKATVELHFGAESNAHPMLVRVGTPSRDALGRNKKISWLPKKADWNSGDPEVYPLQRRWVYYKKVIEKTAETPYEFWTPELQTRALRRAVGRPKFFEAVYARRFYERKTNRKSDLSKEVDELLLDPDLRQDVEDRIGNWKETNPDYDWNVLQQKRRDIAEEILQEKARFIAEFNQQQAEDNEEDENPRVEDAAAAQQKKKAPWIEDLLKIKYTTVREKVEVDEWGRIVRFGSRGTMRCGRFHTDSSTVNSAEESKELNLEVGSIKNCHPCFIVAPNDGSGVSVVPPNTIGSEVVQLVEISANTKVVPFYTQIDAQGRRTRQPKRKSEGPEGSGVVPAESSLVGSGAAALAAAAQDRFATNAAYDVVMRMSDNLAAGNAINYTLIGPPDEDGEVIDDRLTFEGDSDDEDPGYAIDYD